MNADTATRQAWDKVVQLKPRLRAGVHIHHHRYRGVSWYVLQDRTTTQHYRFSKAAYLFICLLNGRHSIQQIHRVLQGRLGQEAPDREQVVQLLAHLHGGELLQYDVAQDAAEIFARRDRTRRGQWLQRMLRPFAWRLHLLNPDALLERMVPYSRHLFGPAGLLLWLLVVGAALLQLPLHWGALSEQWAIQALEPVNLLLILLIYPCVKILHELGHGLATKVWGGDVQDMGLMFLWMMPVPYVDASSSSAFAEKHQRVLVGAMGILVEVLLAALALMIWVRLESGLARDLTFNVMLIGGISTLLFNGNPLLRFDGYYVLADAIEIPNLGTRSKQYLGYLARRYLFGMNEAQSPQTAAGERPWFVFYGIASSIYRIFIVLAIAFSIAGKYFLPGMLLAAWAVVGTLILPLFRGLGQLLLKPELSSHRPRVLLTLTAMAVLAWALVFLVPFASWTRAEGVVRLPEQAHIRAHSDGFVVEIFQRDGESVAANEPLLQLENAGLLADVSILEWKEKELDARSSAQFLGDPIKLQTLRQELATVQEALALKKERKARLQVTSAAPGQFLLPAGDDLSGRFVRKGQTLGYVVDTGRLTARVVVGQAAVDQVRNHTDSIEIRLASRPRAVVQSAILREVPSATNQLPSKALGSLGGGDIQVDLRDERGLRTAERLFQFELALPQGPAGAFIGSRVHVRFNHTANTLARRWYKRLRRLFLQHIKA